ncbi:Ankyrin repeat and KH domain-containing protein 1 [Penicillium hetheringtonii]|uniref:Ankyrin repeat and KH domain-containing protein 1 n=1 Tax=Penicillium hetheringtonii TaxID=911720 RepID=A0AAD6E4L2_9EURO|nr:Ankyrin repeat and KH domain-containing protein 1 [Penicillium hetheringtonii]
MIDVALELRRDNPDVVLSSCTRLADVITPDGMKYGTRYDNGSLTPWPEGQKGLARELRAMHGGLYPQSDLVVADDPDAEVAARTWIDQYSSLNRSELLNKPYYEWLSNEPKVYDAIWEISHGEFLANKCEEYEVGESQGEQRERIETAMDRMYEGKMPVGDVEQMPSSPEIEAQETDAVREDDVTRKFEQYGDDFDIHEGWN